MANRLQSSAPSYGVTPCSFPGCKNEIKNHYWAMSRLKIGSFKETVNPGVPSIFPIG